MALDNPFSTFASGYGQGQNLQAQRQAQSDQQDALQAQQDQQAAATAYEQQQDAQKQQNWQTTFDAGQTQQGVENAGADADRKIRADAMKFNNEYKLGLLRQQGEAAAQKFGQKFADQWLKEFDKQTISGGVPPEQASGATWAIMHGFDHQGNPLTPQAAAHMGQNNLHPFSQVGGQQLGQPQPGQNPFGQGQPDLSQTVPSVQPPTPAPGVGGAPNPLQTPQINYQTPSDNPFNVIQQVQAGQQAQGGLSGAPLPKVQSAMDLQKAQEAKVQAQIQTENALRDPKVQNMISMYTDRNANTAEMQRRDSALADFRNQSLAAKKAFQSAQQALQEAKLDRAGHTTDFKAVTALRGLQNQVDNYDKTAAKINDTIGKLQQQKQTISDLFNAPTPPANNPAAVQQWQQIQLTGRGIMANIDADITRHGNELNSNKEKSQPWREMLQQHQQEINSNGAPVVGDNNSKVTNAMSFGLLPLGSGTPRKPVGSIKPKGSSGTTKKGNTYKVLP